ncbi:MAG: Gfo/Idh/MocA family oxidoreductase, partial [Planctomycetota bacterium]|nr:Gfo/Idh/MocA family oxidoreductase [Planctomycetota bacterium]
QVPRVTTDFREVLADAAVDCISICTDHASHAPIAVAALAAGKHVLCEKALAADEEGLRQMIAAHRQRPDLIFGGVFQHRFDPALRGLKALVEEKALGEILTAGVQVRCFRSAEYYRADAWRGTWRGEGGAVLINQAIHFIDALLWIVGGAVAICGAYANLRHQGVIETEDVATAAVRLRCGALGTIEATSASNLDWEYTISIHGSDGAIDLRDNRPLKVILRDPAKAIAATARLASETSAGVSGKYYYGTGHPAQIADFVAAIREKRQPYVTGLSAAHAVAAVLAIYRSHREGRWIDLPAL